MKTIYKYYTVSYNGTNITDNTFNEWYDYINDYN